MALIILPIHLFNLDILFTSIQNSKLNDKHIEHIYILEEPAYFGNHYIHMNYNKLKLIYHRATMKYYFSYLEQHLATLKKTLCNGNGNSNSNSNGNGNSNGNIIIEYIDYKNCTNKTYSRIKKHTNIIAFNPIDTYVENKYKLFGTKITYLESPLFLCSSNDLEAYHKTKKTKDSFYHASFYTWQRTRMGILANSKTYDTENRNMMPIDTTIPSLPSNDSTSSITQKYITEAITYVQKNWSDNLEPIYCQMKQHTITPESIHFPITHTTAIEWIHHFCKHRFHLFGKYEDSIDSIPRNFLFHSCITPMLNIGLITPQQVIDIITTYYNKHKTEIGIANYEGFIRQIIGWREYQRYIYQYAGQKMRASNHFNNSRRLNNTWYTATTGIKPVDDAVKMALDDGYIHHILRLMVVGNFMNLVGIHPDDVYKWFMEFSLDSYDWVMVGNVYSMALWADGGLTMRKPYISGDGYIMKMGNYTSRKKKSMKVINSEKETVSDSDNELTWNEKWNTIFHDFIDRNSDKLAKTYYAGLVNAWKKKTISDKQKELKIAKDIISSITSK